MGLRIHRIEGEETVEVTEHADDVGRIVIGRDPDQCQVVFPPDEIRVGRVHCSLTRFAHRYRLSYSPRYHLFVNDRPARDGQWVNDRDEIKLGPSGPKIVVEVCGLGGLMQTDIG